MSRRRVLLVGKRPAFERYDEQDFERLARVGCARREELEHSRVVHQRSLSAVRSALADHEVCERILDEVEDGDAEGIDLAVSVGGDGTLLSLHWLLEAIPIIAVNSDPRRSVGHFTRCNADTFPGLLRQVLADEHREEALPRLRMLIDERMSVPVLNDCLFVNSNPAMMTRYVIEVDDQREEHFSSGVWVSTAAGSTAAIASTGMVPTDPHESALFFRVREPYPPRGPFHLLEGRQLPPRGLLLIATGTDCACYVDGGHAQAVTVKPGELLRIDAHPQPLRLCAPSPGAGADG